MTFVAAKVRIRKNKFEFNCVKTPKVLIFFDRNNLSFLLKKDLGESTTCHVENIFLLFQVKYIIAICDNSDLSLFCSFIYAVSANKLLLGA